MIYVQVTGDRHWRDAKVIYSVLAEIDNATSQECLLRSGDAIGADIIADACAQLLWWPEPERYPAEWKKYGPSAGPKRNQLMIDQKPKASLALVFHDNLEKSSGTADMCEKLFKAEIDMFRFTSSSAGNLYEMDCLREFVERL